MSFLERIYYLMHEIDLCPYHPLISDKCLKFPGKKISSICISRQHSSCREDNEKVENLEESLAIINE